MAREESQMKVSARNEVGKGQIFQAHICCGKNGGGGKNGEVKLEETKQNYVK